MENNVLICHLQIYSKLSIHNLIIASQIQFVVAVGHNILKVTERLFVAKGRRRFARLSQY